MSIFRQAYRAFWIIFFCAAILWLGASTTYAQGCPTLFSPNRGWAQNSIVRFWFDSGFTDEQKRQIRAAAAEWNRANSLNNSKVSFVEDTSGTNFSLRFLIGGLGAGNPAIFNATYDAATFTIKSATITYDPNNTFPGSAQLIADPARSGYSTVVMKLVLHEMGHLMGLDHPFVPADPCDQPDGATVLNYACGINDQGNNIPTTVSACDQSTINSESIYPPITLPAPTLQIDSASVANPVSEGAGRAEVVVTRAGDHSTAVSVNYATSDTAGLTNCDVVNGVASSRCDYATAVGTLRFSSGETSKTISIPLVDDSYAEGRESFTIALSNPSGATLSSPTTATITITDNDATTTSNPIDQTPFFVRQHYIDFLGREPDSFGFRGWQDILNNCAAGDTSCDRIEVSSRFFRSAEFQERGYFTYRFYSASFGRKPNYEEFIPDVAKLSGFLTDAEKEANKVAFVDEFMQRVEFKNKYDSTINNPTAYVDALLTTAGLPNHPSRNGWIAGLQNGSLTRGQVLRQLAESAELSDKYFVEAFVVMQYFGYLRRNPDKFYLDWIAIMNQDRANYRNMVNGFMNSTEYRRRFGP
ncbi:MAG TPA: DUF4214 domain-containing protein [Pyrinomonadaceae bacterium]|nr:DUF4214 domain-containing protein [Pyrinomonadaceae bacterium]